MERSEAQEKGLRDYFTGRECRNGHVADRNTASGNCVECAREANLRNREKHVANAPTVEFTGKTSERYEAIISGATKYFTGRPCSKGHLAERYTKSGNCSRCLLENLQAAVGETVAAKAKFMEETELIHIYVYEVDFDIVGTFIATHCNAHMPLGMEQFKETLAKIKEVSTGVHRCHVRVPVAIKKDIYKLAEAFMSQHSAPVVIPQVQL